MRTARRRCACPPVRPPHAASNTASPNPYLSLAAILGAALNGIEDGRMPPEPITGNAYAIDMDHMPDNWADAITLFEDSAIMPRIFASELIRNYLLTKKQERHYMAELSPKEQVEIYLDTV